MNTCEPVRGDALADRIGQYLTEQCLRLAQKFGAAVSEGDASAIHKCRVAVRRQRATLKAFGRLMPRRRRRRAQRALRALATVLAPIRDLDALLERLGSEALAELRAAPDPGLP